MKSSSSCRLAPSLPVGQKVIINREVGGPPEALTFADTIVPVIVNPLDILVQVKSFALNPIDYKVRKGDDSIKPFLHLAETKILGWDGSGFVVGLGSNVSSFNLGDEVYYSGDITRPGSYQQYQLVDSRIVGHKPKSLTFAQAAALPLTSLTAWEAMQEHLRVEKNKRILITAGPGGVGSIAIQLAKHWGLTVTTSIVREDTIDWVKKMGADEIVCALEGYVKEFENKRLEHVNYVFHVYSDQDIKQTVNITKPIGQQPRSGMVGINGDMTVEDLNALRQAWPKRISIHNEFMYTRSLFNVEPERQGQILDQLAILVDAGAIRSTANYYFSWKEIAQAHRLLESRKVVGKIVLTVDENLTPQEREIMRPTQSA